MNILSEALPCRVSAHFDRCGVGLAIRRWKVRSFAFRTLVDEEDRVEVLSKLVAREEVGGARCTISLPVRHCRIQWVPLAGVSRRDLRTAVLRSAFWQARMGVSYDSHCLWWQFTRDDREGGVNALLVAASRVEVESYANTIREAGLVVGRIGVSCFDYLNGGIALNRCEVILILDCGDACVLASGAFGLRVNVVEFDESSAEALLSSDARVRDGVIDNLAACVRRCIEDEQSAAHLRACVRVVTASCLHAEWLELLRSRLPSLQIEWVDGGQIEGVDVSADRPSDAKWCLPRAIAVLDCETFHSGYFTRRYLFPKVNLVERRDKQRLRYRHLVFVASSVVGLSLASALYAHRFLHGERLDLQPYAQRYDKIEQHRGRALEEIRFLRELLSYRVLFYSEIQRISFERKLMPRLLASIEKATLGEVWLNEIHFERSRSIRISGKSPDDEQISRFVWDLREATDIAEVLLESTVVAEIEVQNTSLDMSHRLKDFAVICKLKFARKQV